MNVWGVVLMTFCFVWVGLINAFPVLGLGHGLNMGLLGAYLFLGWLYMMKDEAR